VPPPSFPACSSQNKIIIKTTTIQTLANPNPELTPAFSNSSTRDFRCSCGSACGISLMASPGVLAFGVLGLSGLGPLVCWFMYCVFFFC
jgi:hypothetical protein